MKFNPPYFRSRSSTCPAAGDARLGRTLRIALLIVCSGLPVGCVSLSKKPVSDQVVSARQITMQGIEAMQQCRWDEAELCFSKSIEQYPVDERSHCCFAEVLWRRGAAQQAISHMKEAVRLSAGDAELVVQLGDMYLQQGDLQRAERQANRAIAVQRDMSSAWALRGEVRQRRGQADEALACYHRALGFNRRDPRIETALAGIYLRQGKPQQALTIVGNLIDRHPLGEAPAEALYQQGLALKTLHRHNDAAEVFLALRRRGPASPDLLFHLSEAQLLAGDPANARLTVSAALRLAPDHEPIRRLRAAIEISQQQMAGVNQR